MDTLKITICNEALALISITRIQDINEKTAEARACRDTFDRVLAEMLRLADWNFARRKVALALLREEGGKYIYKLPVDCVFALKIGDAPFRVTGDEIYCDVENAQLEYTTKAISLGTIDPLFRSALIRRIAAEICKELTTDTALQGMQYQLYQQFLAEARQRDACEGKPIVKDVNPFVDCR